VNRSSPARTRVVDVTRSLLARWPLPLPSASGDKEDRGRLLLIAGAPDVPGAAILAANAALRSGLGKLTIATTTIAPVAQAIPEARVVGFDARRGTIRVATGGADDVFDAILVGPGLSANAALSRCVRNALAAAGPVTVVVDAGALRCAVEDASLAKRRSGQARCVLTPHAGEMAGMLGIAKSEIERDPCAFALRLATEMNVVVVLKGPITYIASRGNVWVHNVRNPGLATSGSGDVLAGVIGALSARGATPEQAAVWGVALHAMAGARLVRRHGALGALARELPHEIPVIMNAFSAPARRQNRRA